MLLDGGTSPYPASVSRRSFGTFSHEALQFPGNFCSLAWIKGYQTHISHHWFVAKKGSALLKACMDLEVTWSCLLAIFFCIICFDQRTICQLLPQETSREHFHGLKCISAQNSCRCSHETRWIIWNWTKSSEVAIIWDVLVSKCNGCWWNATLQVCILHGHSYESSLASVLTFRRASHFMATWLMQNISCTARFHLKTSQIGLSVQMREETNSAASWTFISTNPGQLNPKFYKGTFEPASKSTSKGRAHRSACKRETSWLRFSIWTSHHRKWRKACGRCCVFRFFVWFMLRFKPLSRWWQS